MEQTSYCGNIPRVKECAMRKIRLIILAVSITLAGVFTIQAADRFVSLQGGHVPPFTNWADAATNIQDAIDVAVSGETVWVTNGTYSIGGKVMAGDLTNRVALDKALTVQSVLGPNLTTIEGLGPNGSNAVRCAWLTNGARLSGFTLQHGATRFSGDSVTLQSGGGVWSASKEAMVTNCNVRWNSANGNGGGVYRGTVANSSLQGNRADISGGGAASAYLIHCVLKENDAAYASGGGAFYSTLTNCAVTDNTANSAGGTWSCSLYSCTVTRNSSVGLTGGVHLRSFIDVVQNSIIYSNIGWVGSLQSQNYNYPQSMRQSCTTPLPSGVGNITSDPQLLSDGVHLSEGSPCRGVGSAEYATGTDIDGQTWMNPPSMGCDEWHAEPFLVGIPELSYVGAMGEVTLKAFAVGAEPVAYEWLKNGVLLSDGGAYSGVNTSALQVRVNDPSVAGKYQTLASNSYGMTTGQVMYLNLHYVKAGSLTSIPPFGEWNTAAATIQNAVDVAADGAVVVVTNGIYAVGGRTSSGDLTNRVAVEKELTVLSLNGAEYTTIQGAWDPVTTNGLLAVRCVSLALDAALKGFTLRGGATHSEGLSVDTVGGGVYSVSGVVANCRIINNRAAYKGGGVAGSILRSCEVTGNASDYGGGASSSHMFNCTVTGNTAAVSGGGTYYVAARNSIIYFNAAPSNENSAAGSRFYCCTTPQSPGPGNIADDPQLLDGFRLAASSPCRGMGSTLYATYSDLDGEAWLSPPSMGCDEFYAAGLNGPLSVVLEVPDTNVVQGVSLSLTGLVEGRAFGLAWDFGNGAIATNVSYLTLHNWSDPGDYIITFTAFNNDNPDGVSTNVLMHVEPLESPELSMGGLTNTQFSMEFTSQAGVGYVVEQATDLVSPVVWSTVTNLTGTGSMEQVVDTMATNAMRFYRVRVP